MIYTETSKRCRQFRQAIHLGEARHDPHRQAVHDEFGPERICRIFILKPRVYSARVKISANRVNSGTPSSFEDIRVIVS